MNQEPHSHQDVSERPQEGLHYLATLVDSSEDAILGKTLDGIITSWNRGAERLYGYSSHEALGQPITLIVPPERREELHTVMARVRSGEAVDAFETVRVRRDGTLVEVSVQLSPIKAPDGQVLGISTIARDITARKRVDAERRHILASLRCLLWSAEVRGLSDAGFTEVTTRFTDPEIAERFLPIARTPGEPFYRDWYRARLEEDTRACNQRGVAALIAGSDYSQEFRIRLADGSIRWLHEDIKVEVVETGSRWSLVGLCTDVTERKRAQESIERLQSEAQERALMLAAANRVAQEVLASSTGSEALHSITEAARSLAGARYAALGVARPGTHELMEFVTVGLGAEEEARIGPRPKGQGVLGLLLRQSAPLRIGNLGQHPASAGFPPNHPPMQSFLGVPILQGETVLGSLYLTDKQGGQDFTEADEAAVAALGAYAAIAIHNLHTLLRQRAMVGQLINAQEEERRAVAYDLHDGLTQYVMASHAYLESAGRAYAQERREKAQRDMEQGLKYLKEAVTESRRLVNGLRALALDDLGLAGALEQLLQEEKLRAGWREVQFEHNLADVRFEPMLETALYRVVQEALTNARKYASAERVALQLISQTIPATGQRQLHLEVRDWGAGFEPEERMDDQSRVGMHSMRERVLLLGGTYGLESAPGHGTRIHAIVPAQPLDPSIDGSEEQTSP